MTYALQRNMIEQYIDDITPLEFIARNGLEYTPEMWYLNGDIGCVGNYQALHLKLARLAQPVHLKLENAKDEREFSKGLTSTESGWFDLANKPVYLGIQDLNFV